MSSSSPSLKLPGKVEHAVRWLVATLEGNCGPGNEFEIPLRHLILKGGRGSGKSHTAARIVVNVVKALGIRALCTRETQKSIEESVYQLLNDVIEDLGYEDYFTPTKTTIDSSNGGNILFAGLRQQDVAKLKSTERIVLCWCEEAHVLSEKSLDVLTPTIREENSVIMYTYNPELDDDPVHARFAMDPQPDVCVVHMNWRDNYWFPKVLEGERKRSYEMDKSPGKVKYNWIWEGACLPAVEGAIYANEVAKLFEEGRVRPLDHDSSGLTYGIMDLGWGVMAMTIVQRFASTIQIIGYGEWTHTTYEQMTRELEKYEYRWGKIFMPHDATHKDPKYGKSHMDVMTDLGWNVEQIPNVGIENYVALGRDMFENTYISDKEDCKRLLQCLKRWRRQIPVTTAHPGAPAKDEWSHGAESFCYTAVVADQLVNDAPQIKDPYKGLRSSGYAA